MANQWIQNQNRYIQLNINKTNWNGKSLTLAKRGIIFQTYALHQIVEWIVAVTWCWGGIDESNVEAGIIRVKSSCVSSLVWIANYTTCSLADLPTFNSDRRSLFFNGLSVYKWATVIRWLFLYCYDVFYCIFTYLHYIHIINRWIIY